MNLLLLWTILPLVMMKVILSLALCNYQMLLDMGPVGVMLCFCNRLQSLDGLFNNLYLIEKDH